MVCLHISTAWVYYNYSIFIIIKSIFAVHHIKSQRIILMALIVTGYVEDIQVNSLMCVNMWKTPANC